MSEKKRVAFAIESICDGGLERRTVNLVNELSKSNNIDVCLISGAKKIMNIHCKIVSDGFRLCRAVY